MRMVTLHVGFCFAVLSQAALLPGISGSTHIGTEEGELNIDVKRGWEKSPIPKGYKDMPFYVIAHMANNIAGAKWAISQGANALEMDLQFDSKTGAPLYIKHGPLCDCNCKWKKGICRYVSCNSKSQLAEYFGFLATTNISLIYIDSKITGFDETKRRLAGIAVIKMLDRYLFEKGYQGQVLINSPRVKTVNYLEAAIEESEKFKFKEKIYYAIDSEKNNIIPTLEKLATLNTDKLIYGTGKSACIPDIISKHTIHTAVANIAAGVVSVAYVWTFDKASSMSYYANLVQGYITNFPARGKQVALQAGRVLATTRDVIPKATSRAVIRGSCKCSYVKRLKSCVITQAAPPRAACQCVLKRILFKKHCRGYLTYCKEPNSALCTHPDTSYESCVMGDGNCKGYE